jgi:hypothetical protein
LVSNSPAKERGQNILCCGGKWRIIEETETERDVLTAKERGDKAFAAWKAKYIDRLFIIKELQRGAVQ